MSTVPTSWSDQFGVKTKSAGFLGMADRITIVDCNPAVKSLGVDGAPAPPQPVAAY